MAVEGLIRRWISEAARHKSWKSSNASVFVVEAVSSCSFFHTKKFPPADNLIKAKNFLPFCTDTFLTEWVSGVNK